MSEYSQDGTDSKKTDEEIIEVALERFQAAEEYETKIRTEAIDDLKFRIGEQWPDDIKANRQTDGRPCLVINRLPQHIRQVTNDQRQNRPGIKVSPVDDFADPDTAKIYQGLIRHIEYNSNADVAYDTAFSSAVEIGRGFYRIITDYCDPMSFEQEILIKRIRNRFSAYIDPNHQEPDGSDANWGFVFENMSHDDYRARWGESALQKQLEQGDANWSTMGDQTRDWVNKNTIRVAEYFYKTFETKKIILLSNEEGLERVVTKDEWEDKEKDFTDIGFKKVTERDTTLPAIKWCITNGFEILEQTDWPGRWIPIIPVIGDEVDVDGEVQYEGIIRHAKDPQRMYNYWASAETETIALAPKAPFIGAEGQFENHEHKWETANVQNHAYLEYKPTTVDGQLAPPPTRNVHEPPVAAITNARMNSSEDIKSTTGVYDASLGNRSNENSGIAIQRRNQQSQTSNFHYVDNLTRSIRHTGRILVDLIPKVYDTERAVRIIGEENKEEVVKINQEFEKNGEKKKYMMGVGKYDVTVDTGPSYQTKRQEAAESMIQMVNAYPDILKMAGDILVENMDWPGARALAERIKKLNPEIQRVTEEEKDQPIPGPVKAKLDQAMQMIEALTQQLNEANQELDSKRMELTSEEKIAFAKMEAELIKELIKQDSADSRALLDKQFAEINERQRLIDMREQNRMKMNGAGQPNGSVGRQNNNQPTGGPSPGKPMGV